MSLRADTRLVHPNRRYRMNHGLALQQPAAVMPPARDIHEVVPVYGETWWCLAAHCPFLGDQSQAVRHAVENQFDT